MGETKVTADEMLSGDIRMRQGGDPDDFSVSGITDYSEVRKNMMKQIGVASSSSGGTVDVVFSVPFSNTPLIMLTVFGATVGMPQLTAVSTTGFTFKCSNILGALLGGVKVNWTAEGRR